VRLLGYKALSVDGSPTTVVVHNSAGRLLCHPYNKNKYAVPDYGRHINSEYGGRQQKQCEFQ
jgi:hypothetical protein